MRCEICGGLVGPPDHDEAGDCLPQSATQTNAVIDAANHEASSTGRLCLACGFRWPCDQTTARRVLEKEQDHASDRVHEATEGEGR